MAHAKFDTMAAMQQLQRAGVAQQQAEAIVTAISDSQRNLATKDDVQQLRRDMDAGFALMQTQMEKAVLASQRTILLALGGSTAVAVAAIGVIIALTQR